MSYFPCPICTQTDGFHTSGCREAPERIATLESQLAEARRPEMVRELPNEEGWYWRRRWDLLQAVSVFKNQGIWVYIAPGDSSSHGIWHDEDVFWSAKPIPCDPMPKEAQ